MNREISPASEVPGLKDFLPDLHDCRPARTRRRRPLRRSVSASPCPRAGARSGTVSFSLSVSASVTVTITTSAGPPCARCCQARRAPGRRASTWDRKNAKGQRVKAGTYKATVNAVDSAGTPPRETSPSPSPDSTRGRLAPAPRLGDCRLVAGNVGLGTMLPWRDHRTPR